MIVLVADARTQWAETDRLDRNLRYRVRPLGEGEVRRGSAQLMTIEASARSSHPPFVAAVRRAESLSAGAISPAWLGLVPRQFTTGGKPKLLGDQQARQQAPAPGS